jgi:hypothetical protein
MKTPITNLTFLFLFISSILVLSCEKDEFYELEINDNNPVIEKSVNGIDFKFCLLNEKGEPATIFEEGENFTFRFSFQNNLEDSITVNTSFVTNNFFEVTQRNNGQNIDLGKPYTGIWCEYVGGPKNFVLPPNATGGVQCPWVAKDEKNIQPFCASKSKEALNSGMYFTQFELDFQYMINEKEFKISNKNFKINFEVN